MRFVATLVKSGYQIEGLFTGLMLCHLALFRLFEKTYDYKSSSHDHPIFFFFRHMYQGLHYLMNPFLKKALYSDLRGILFLFLGGLTSGGI